jgi:hypothetical protein
MIASFSLAGGYSNAVIYSMFAARLVSVMTILFTKGITLPANDTVEQRVACRIEYKRMSTYANTPMSSYVADDFLCCGSDNA